MLIGYLKKLIERVFMRDNVFWEEKDIIYEEIFVKQLASSNLGPDDTIRKKLDAYWSMSY